MADPEKIVWKQFNQIPENDWGSEIARDCYVGKVFRVLACRSSWDWSTSIRGMRSVWDGCIYQYNIDNAKHVAEGCRQRGTSFIISQDPCLVITGDNEAICIADWRNEFLQSNFQENKEQQKTLKEVAKALNLYGNIYYYITTPTLVEKPGLGYYRFSSRFSNRRMIFDDKELNGTEWLENLLELQKKAWKLILK